MTWARKKVVSIVEGRGEERAVPALVDRWIKQHRLYAQFEAVPSALCARGVGSLVAAPRNPGEQRGVEYYVNIARAQGAGAVLVVLDADNECVQRASSGREPLGVEILRRARACARDLDIAVVVADREFEAWFVEHRVSLEVLNPDAWEGTRPVEAVADCKKVVGAMLNRRYDPVIDQPKLAAKLPLLPVGAEALAGVSRSYRKLMAALAQLMPPSSSRP